MLNTLLSGILLKKNNKKQVFLLHLNNKILYNFDLVSQTIF